MIEKSESSFASANLLSASLSGVDPIGRVFFLGDRVLRGINLDAMEETRALLDSGLIQRLTDEGLFPATKISDQNVLGFGMILEHRRLHPLVLPSEWSPGMFRDAALALIEVNRIARSFGYETKDAHPYNLCFVGTQPVFFDLGSFIQLTARATQASWLGYDEFIRSFRYPLVLGQQAGPAVLRLLTDFGTKRVLSHGDYFRLRLGAMAPWLPHRALARTREAYARLLRTGSMSDAVVDEKLAAKPLARFVLKTLRSSGFFRLMSADFARLHRRIARTGGRKLEARWASYQQELRDDEGNPALDPRYHKICDLLSKLKPKSVLELGGNMGVFSVALRRSVTQFVTYTDCDEEAVEGAYASFKYSGNSDITAAVIDLVENNQSIKVPPIADRYRADAVVALAFTHHQILSQGVPGELFMHRLAAFCTRYAVVEFMPMDLWAGGPWPPIPSWYTFETFCEHFKERFELLHEERLEPNRIVLIGQKREEPDTV